MHNFITSAENFSTIIKLILSLLIQPFWTVYRFCCAIDDKNVLAFFISIVYPMIPITWFIDPICIIFTGNVWCYKHTPVAGKYLINPDIFSRDNDDWYERYKADYEAKEAMEKKKSEKHIREVSLLDLLLTGNTTCSSCRYYSGGSCTRDPFDSVDVSPDDTCSKFSRS